MKNIIIIMICAIFSSCIKSNDVVRLFIPETIDVVDEAILYCNANDFNEDFCILIDMGMHSGRKRFFIVNLKTKEVEKSYLVSHGCGDSLWSGDFTKTNPTFSNVNNSHSSSLGKYRIGERGWSSYGVNINYRIHGLENTNSNASSRGIVFHSWDPVSDTEIYPRGTPEGWGCPAVSNNAFLEIDSLLKRSKKSTLMWIYK
ncbi:murein L,D-transpeptidase catalytic domain family protein [Flavobacteriales bacterium]|nr:murein L,D-transpeptidase catalytic domain family protein [Flavobacteriales bacterium]